ncbi:MAG TPA: fibronectin type III domain-containing protein [Nitrospirae bacterium]|nr:fibronectin type III domain-containing protein [Nitrospirota bacterium]
MADDRILLATQKKKISDKAHDGNVIGTNMGADSDSDISDAGDALLANSDDIDQKIKDRDDAEAAAIQLTGELNDLEEDWDKLYKAAAEAAEKVHPNDAPVWQGFGFQLADVEPTDRSLPPKVTGLQVTQGDAANEGDLVWDPLPQADIDGYFIEVNPTDPIDPAAWVSAKPRSVSKSKVTITGLITRQKYWVRIIAFIGRGEGPPSDPKSFIAP